MSGVLSTCRSRAAELGAAARTTSHAVLIVGGGPTGLNDLGEGHPLLGRRMPDLDLTPLSGPLRLFTLLRDARPVMLNLGEPGDLDITPWADRVQQIDARYAGTWELPVLGAVTAPAAVLIRPDGYAAWVGDLAQPGLADALTTWFGPPAAQPNAASSDERRTGAGHC